ncbi:MAG: cell division topological specificity factor MinE [Anaerolineae bacterium]|nr:cell division topological specificity factor MinE [Anaerolineae bacterium]MDQ7034953.1 cell division topological specificity factor MinE [Anaerolineae bacterium]
MAGFFDRMLGRNSSNKGSSTTAKDRLKFVLLHERVKIAPEKMREMKAEIVAVIAKYVPGIDPDTVDIAIEQSDRYENKLVAEIPFSKTRAEAAAESDSHDDLSVSDDALVEADSASEMDADLKFHTDETIPNPTIQNSVDVLDEAETDEVDD